MVACLLIPVESLSANDERDISPEETLLTEADDDSVYALEDVCYPPQFPGGTEAMYQWIGTNFQYPPSATDEGTLLRIVLEFVVTKDGDIDKIKVMQCKNPSLEKEAFRMMNDMPKWTPGRNCNGEPVNVAFVLPIQFKLN